MYRSNHFEAPNEGHGFAGEQSSPGQPNKQTPFTSSVQALGANGHLGANGQQRQVQSSRPLPPEISQTNKFGSTPDSVPVSARSHTPYKSQGDFSGAIQSEVIQTEVGAQKHYQPHQQVKRSPSLSTQIDQQITAQRSNSLHTASQHMNSHPLNANEMPANDVPDLDRRSQTPSYVAHQVSHQELAKDLDQPGIDLQIKALFTAMGRASQMSRAQLAARLQASPALISSLENGELSSLPEWEELEPVIARYAELMNIDERPIVRRLREQITEHTLSNMTSEAPGVVPHPHAQQHSYNQEQNQVSTQLHTAYKKQASLTRGGTSLMPNSDQSLKDFANGQMQKAAHNQNSALSSDPLAAGLAQHQHQTSIEDRFSALTSAVTNSQNSSHIIAQSQTNVQPLDVRAALAGAPLQQTQQGDFGQQTDFANPNMTLNAENQNGAPYEKAKSKNKWLRIFGNFALVVILLAGFISWQPNRFWSGVDQLPKPISKSIYAIFEFVMPDPLASVYRMNWVYVADPRMRKADKLPVPVVRKLPRIDFSQIGR